MPVHSHDVSRTGIGDIPLAGRLHLPSGAARDTAIFVTHGANVSAFTGVAGWIGQALAEAGFATLCLNRRDAVDLRPADVLFDDGLDDLRQGFDLLADHGYNRVVLLAHSLGTIFASAYAGRISDDRLVGLILLGAIDDVPRSQRVKVQGEHFDRNVALAQSLMAEGKGDDVLKFPTAVGRPIPRTPRSFLSWWGPGEGGAPWRDITNTRVPVLICCSTTDGLTPPEMGQRLFQAGRAANITVDNLLIVDPDESRNGLDGHHFVGNEATLVRTVGGWVEQSARTL